MWICPNHRCNLGRNWRPLKTCQYPPHSGARKKLKNKDVIHLQMSKNIQSVFGVTIPIGSGKRVAFNNYKCQHCLKNKWGMERPYFKKQFCRVLVILTWQVVSILFMRLNWRLLVLERRVIIESRSSIAALIGQFLCYKGRSTQIRRSTTYVSGHYFSVYLSSNLYLLHEQTSTEI